MAKLETTLRGSLDQWAEKIETGLLEGSISASVAERSAFRAPDGSSQCRVLVFERFSMLASDWLSLSVTLFQDNTGLIHCSAISSGSGSMDALGVGALGGKSFLGRLRKLLEQ